MEGRGKGGRLLCSLKLPYLSTMSQQFCHRLQHSIYSLNVDFFLNDWRNVFLNSTKASVWCSCIFSPFVCRITCHLRIYQLKTACIAWGENRRIENDRSPVFRWKAKTTVTRLKNRDSNCSLWLQTPLSVKDIRYTDLINCRLYIAVVQFHIITFLVYNITTVTILYSAVRCYKEWNENEQNLLTYLKFGHFRFEWLIDRSSIFSTSNLVVETIWEVSVKFERLAELLR